MKGGITLGIYIAIGFIPMVFGPAAVGQSSTHYKTWPEALRQVEQSATIPPGWKPNKEPELLAGLRPAPILPPARPAALGKPVVMNGGMGGLISEHQLRFLALKQQNATVEMRGPCWSACTLITGYIPKERLCFGTGSFLAFHAAQTADHRHSINDTWLMYWRVPEQIRDWLDANGGPLKMTVNNYWFLRDVDLWKMGYPKCS